MKKLFRIFYALFIIYTLAAVGFFVYTFFDSDNTNDGEFDYFSPVKFVYGLFEGVPDKTNFVIFGTDEGGTRTDTIITGCYDKSDGSLKLVSIPRDTIVTVNSSDFNKMSKGYPEPGSRTMKLNSVYHYSQNEYGADIAVSQVEKIIGADIDYYCVVDFDALNYIVDEIGGVDFYVPCDMYYSDPEQNLYIELYEGQQTLSGDEAEQLLRFRSGYADADLGRVNVQQDFMKAFITQAMSRKNITGNFSKYIKAFSKYVKTDMPVSLALKYAASVNKHGIADISAVTLPGYTDYVDGVSGFVYDGEDKVMEEIFD